MNQMEKMSAFQQFRGKKKAVLEKLCEAVRGAAHPDADGLKTAALHVWAKLVGLYAAVCACFRRPGLSEAAAVTAFGISVIGSITAIFRKKLRRLMPLFGALAALGTAIVVLRCLFPRDRD